MQSVVCMSSYMCDGWEDMRRRWGRLDTQKSFILAKWVQNLSNKLLIYRYFSKYVHMNAYIDNVLNLALHILNKCHSNWKFIYHHSSIFIEHTSVIRRCMSAQYVHCFFDLSRSLVFFRFFLLLSVFYHSKL